MEGVKELPEDVTAAAAVPTIDWVYIRSTERQIAARHLRAGSLRTKVLELFDVANNIGKDEYRVGSITSHVTQQKRAEVAAQINSIEAEENRNTDAVEKFEAKLREHWATYAAFHCRAFCDYIRQRLPRELRMIVFEALWKDAQHTITDWNLQALATKPVNPVALVESWSGRDTRHCFDERFVGPDLQHEILDPWWRMSVFNFKTSRLIPHFLNEDFWGAIVKDQIRNVVVSLSYREWMSGPMTGTRWLKSQIKTTVSGADIDSELDYLGNLSPTSRIALSIKKRDFRHYIRSTVQQRQNAFLAALSHLFVGLAKLRSDGYHVCVLVDNDIEIKIDHADISMEGWRKQLDNAVDAFDQNQYAAKEEANIGRCWPLIPRGDYTITEEEGG